jgi:hypothetical protein
MRSLRLTGKAIFGGDDSSIEARWAQVVKKPGLIRSEVSLQGLTAVNAWAGDWPGALAGWRPRVASSAAFCCVARA